MQASADKIWTSAQEQLRSMLSTDVYNLWFAPLRASAQDPNSIVLEVADDFCEVWLKENYMSLLEDVLAVASGQQLQVRFKVASPSGSPASAPAVQAAARTKAATPSAPDRSSTNHDLNFNPKNTFDTFVVGNNNH